MKAIENITTVISTLMTAASMLITVIPLVTGDFEPCGAPLKGSCAGTVIY